MSVQLLLTSNQRVVCEMQLPDLPLPLTKASVPTNTYERVADDESTTASNYAIVVMMQC